MRKFLFFVVLIILMSGVAANAAPPLNLDSPAVILAEQTTGRVLYSRNERERRYPANLTKMLTALVAVDHLALDDVIIVGQEIRGMPAGFVANTHFEGETITVQMLLNSLLIRSANEAGRILALNVIRQRDGRWNIPMEQANSSFAALLNEKARSLGARGTNFNNAFGHHNDNHFTTAYDLALITRAFMDNPVLAQIAGTRTFEGDSLNGITHPEPNVREYSWTSTNQMLPHGQHGHPYMIGAKAGFTISAGHILAGAAEHNGLQLVTVVLGGTDAARWQDTRRLMDYGFGNFSFREIARTGDDVKDVLIENPRLGDSETLTLILGESTASGENETFTALVSHAEYAAITKTFTFDPLLLVEFETPQEKPTLRAPIEDGAAIGTVTYSANGLVLFEIPVLATRAVEERTFDSDMDYHLAAIFGNIFSRRAIPYYFGIFGTLFGIFGIVIAAKSSRSKYNRY
ncbi:MAG: D-alanyl-D-alanine carboxypeptidase [Defluviitaleaceae bacterium]|nr:D-alanyl-D-alanine carboxypeptidase [Defluviitaleaceae bacterium]MCL2264219.1 D-alanyl-D-alanine carboxypeptidase [Defluviitaleaceae bacterium]